MGGCGRLLPWVRCKVWDRRIEGTSCFEALNSHECCHTIANNIQSAYIDPWYCLKTITDASKDFATRNQDNVASFRDTAVTQRHSIPHARCGGEFVSDLEFEPYRPHKLQLVHILSTTNYHIAIGFRQSHADGSSLTRGIDSQIVNIDDLSVVKAICVPVSLCVNYFWIPVTKLWDMIICWCVCKDRPGQANVFDSKPRWWLTKERYLVLPVMLKWDSKI